jgi:hypothetical protein
MKKASVLISIAAIFFILVYSAEAGEQTWWEKFDRFPNNTKAPRIMPEQVKRMLKNGEKMVFVYAGYDVDKVLCGSVYLPYTLVPPESDGSRVNFKVFPKDIWIMCYCP